MKHALELMVQHRMKLEYAYDISSDADWVRATAPNGKTVSVKGPTADLKVNTQSCIYQLSDALKWDELK